MGTVAVKPRRWSREEYERLVGQGVLREDERLELIEGEILEMAPQSARHSGTVQLVQEALTAALREGFCLRVQLPLALGADSEPEPDLAVVEGSARTYLEAHPATAALVVEVADTSLAFDRRRKLPVYAAAEVPEVWLVDLVDGTVEVHAEPAGRRFRRHEVARVGDRLESPVLRRPIRVADLLP